MENTQHMPALGATQKKQLPPPAEHFEDQARHFVAASKRQLHSPVVTDLGKPFEESATKMSARQLAERWRLLR